MDEVPLHNPHDAFIKAGLGEPAQMADFLQACHHQPVGTTGRAASSPSRPTRYAQGDLLERLLVRKFGELEYTVLEKLNHAGQADLERWGERILDAKTLDEVFAQ